MSSPTDFSTAPFGRGLVQTVLVGYVALLRARTGIALVELEPVPVEKRQMGLEVTPGSLRLERDGTTREGGRVYRAELAHVLVLTGKGSGLHFLDVALEACLRCEVAFGDPLNIPLGPGRFASSELDPNAESAGRFYESDGEAGGHLFERAWDGVLRWPLTVGPDDLPGRTPFDPDRADFPSEGIPIEVPTSA